MVKNCYRNLKANEITVLERQGNNAQDWSQVKVQEGFAPEQIWNSRFSGEVLLGATKEGGPSDSLPDGISNSRLHNCQVGACCKIHDVRLLSNYCVGDNCELFDIGEMVWEGEPEWMEVMNESGGRKIQPFATMRLSDAYLWAKYRDRKALVEALTTMTHNSQPAMGRIGNNCKIKHTKRIKNVVVNSDSEAPSRIEDCIALKDGVVGFGCKLEEGCMLERFLLGENVKIEMGARINDTVVGDNSTVARCEVGNSMIFPAHEQHHNNSFLIAALVMGQSNVAAGATIGSNHNGRTADNELVAGRGFWPGLCASFKHSSSFASYCLLAKGDYPAELDIRLPFCLVNNNVAKNRLEVMPAYWWLYNMYALARNERKFAARDKRVKRSQHVVFDPLAPDTAEEIVCGRELLRHWTELSYANGVAGDKIEITATGMEKGKRKTVILKAAEGYAAYADMLVYYAMNTLATEEGTLPSASLASNDRERAWVNLGGQLLRQTDLDKMIADIESGKLDSWDAIHVRLDQLWEAYPTEAKRHAYHLLCEMNGCKELTQPIWDKLLQRYQGIKQYVQEQVRVTREKDNANPFRKMTYRNDAEMEAVI